MSNVAQYDFRAGPPPVGPSSGGGDMEDVLRRLGSLEKDVSVIKTEVSAIVALLPQLASKADVAQLPYMATKEDVALLKADIGLVRADVSGVVALLPHFATKADIALVKTDIALVKAEISDARASIIQWMVSTMIAVAALAFTIAKFVH